MATITAATATASVRSRSHHPPQQLEHRGLFGGCSGKSIGLMQSSVSTRLVTTSESQHGANGGKSSSGQRRARPGLDRVLARACRTCRLGGLKA